MIKKIKSAASAAIAILRGDPIKSLQDLLKVCSEVGKNQILRDARKQERDAAVKVAADPHDPFIVEYDQLAQEGTRRIQAFAEQNRASLFGKNKTYVIAGHELAFRSNGGAVATLNGAKDKDVAEFILNLPVADDFTPDEITAMAPQHLEELAANEEMKSQFLRFKVELNKEAVERFHRMSEGQPQRRAHLTRVNLTVQETESFIFTPAREQNAEITVKLASTQTTKEAA